MEIEALKRDQLDPNLRAKLAMKRLSRLEELSAEENERLWAAQALRRQEGLEKGLAPERPASDVFCDAKSRLR